jgi:hypothetical protein
MLSYWLLEVSRERLLNYWKSICGSHSREHLYMFRKLEKMTLMTNNCIAATESTMHLHALFSKLWYWELYRHLQSVIIYKKHILNLAPCLPNFAEMCLSSQYIKILLSEDGQSSFYSLSWKNYIYIENYMVNCFLTHMVLVSVYVRMKWHYFIIDFKHPGYQLQHEALKSRINIKIHFVFCNWVFYEFAE